MARPRAFDEQVVIRQAAELFAAQGFNGTSVDDLVKVTGLMRGSIYKAFGSKRNLFLTALTASAENFNATRHDLDLISVALKELAGQDPAVAKICNQVVDKFDSNFALLLGENLLRKMKGSD